MLAIRSFLLTILIGPQRLQPGGRFHVHELARRGLAALSENAVLAGRVKDGEIFGPVRSKLELCEIVGDTGAPAI